MWTKFVLKISILLVPFILFLFFFYSLLLHIFLHYLCRSSQFHLQIDNISFWTFRWLSSMFRVNSEDNVKCKSGCGGCLSWHFTERASLLVHLVFHRTEEKISNFHRDIFDVITNDEDVIILFFIQNGQSRRNALFLRLQWISSKLSFGFDQISWPNKFTDFFIIKIRETVFGPSQLVASRVYFVI